MLMFAYFEHGMDTDLAEPEPQPEVSHGARQCQLSTVGADVLK
jgi:hypothetical protein